MQLALWGTPRTGCVPVPVECCQGTARAPGTASPGMEHKLQGHAPLRAPGARRGLSGTHAPLLPTHTHTPPPPAQLCGSAMNVASRMESTSRPGMCQVSEAAYALLPAEDQALLRPTGGVDVKGIGEWGSPREGGPLGRALPQGLATRPRHVAAVWVGGPQALGKQGHMGVPLLWGRMSDFHHPTRSQRGKAACLWGAHPHNHPHPTPPHRPTAPPHCAPPPPHRASTAPAPRQHRASTLGPPSSPVSVMLGFGLRLPLGGSGKSPATRVRRRRHAASQQSASQQTVAATTSADVASAAAVTHHGSSHPAPAAAAAAAAAIALRCVALP
jgi:hypothetical protein